MEGRTVEIRSLRYYVCGASGLVICYFCGNFGFVGFSAFYGVFGFCRLATFCGVSGFSSLLCLWCPRFIRFNYVCGAFGITVSTTSVVSPVMPFLPRLRFLRYNCFCCVRAA